MERIASKIEHYEQIIIALLQEEAGNWHNKSPQELVLADKEKHHYQLLLTGWADDSQFVNDILVHFSISEDGKIWLLENNSEWLVAEELVKRGVPGQDIVIGFHPPQYRKYTDFAVA
ncbi:MAG: XisI protein [Saprospiraceae bacterium]